MSEAASSREKRWKGKQAKIISPRKRIQICKIVSRGAYRYQLKGVGNCLNSDDFPTRFDMCWQSDTSQYSCTDQCSTEMPL